MMISKSEPDPLPRFSSTVDKSVLKKINVFKTVYPFFFGFSADLLFWVAIDTLFLSIVKGIDAARIVFLTDFSLIASIVFYFPVSFIIKKLGNTVSVKVGVVMSVLAASLLTFAKSYYLLLLGMTFKQVGLWFYEMNSIILKNNLEYTNCCDEFAKYQTKGYTVYSVFTAVIAFIASPMFNIYRYLPMLCCIACTLISFGLSFFIKDYSGKDGKSEEHNEKIHINYKKFLIFILVYGFTFSIFASAQSEGKLFVQDEFFKCFSEKNVVFLIGLMISISRIVRIIADVISYRLYIRFKEKIFPILSSIFLFSMLTVTFSSFIPQKNVRVAMMIFGYVILLFLRDPYKVFIYDFVLSICSAEEQKKIILLFQFSNKIIYAAVLLAFSKVLLTHTTLAIMYILIVFSVIALALNIYIMVKGKKLHAKKA